MALNFIQITSSIAIFQSLFMSVQLWINGKNSSLKNRLLSAYMITLSVIIFCSLSVTAGVEQIFLPFHKYIFIGNQAAFLFGPLLYLYIKSNIINQYKPDKAEILHFVPFAVMVVFYSVQIYPLDNFIIWEYKFWLVNSVLVLVHNLVYFVLSITLLIRKKYKHSISSRMMWLLLVSFIVMWSIQLNILVVLYILNYYSYCPHMTSLYSICAFLFINTVVYLASRKSEFYNQLNKYESSLISNSDLEALTEKLLRHMEQEKPYLKSDLSLSDLAGELSLPHRELSRLINESFSRHFYDFINLYRVSECKRLLSNSPNGHSMLEIAYESGFSSKSTFNKAFKKHTGLTPKEYKNMCE